MDATPRNPIQTPLKPSRTGVLDSPFVRFFARETASTAFIPAVDGLRLVAIATVVLYHVASYIGNKLYAVPAGVHLPAAQCENAFYRFGSLGFFGVQLFFAISGFILAVPFARRYLEPGARPISIKSYFIRRVTRLEPPYIFNLIVLTILLVVVKHQEVTETLKHLLASIAYVHYYVYHDGSTINGVAWSLEVEVQFYILAPLLSCVFAVKNPLVRRAVIVGAIVVCCLAQEVFAQPLWHGQGIWNQFQYFFVGFLLADKYLTDWKNRERTVAGDIAGFAGWGGLICTLFLLVRPGSVSHGAVVHLLATTWIFAAYAGAFRGRLMYRFFSQPLLFLIGGMCYTIYLWHFLVVSAVGSVLLKIPVKTGNPGIDLAIYFAVLFPLVVGASAVLFVLIEKPCMKKDWPQRLLSYLGRKAPPASGR